VKREQKKEHGKGPRLWLQNKNGDASLYLSPVPIEEAHLVDTGQKPGKKTSKVDAE